MDQRRARRHHAAAAHPPRGAPHRPGGDGRRHHTRLRSGDPPRSPWNPVLVALLVVVLSILVEKIAASSWSAFAPPRGRHGTLPAGEGVHAGFSFGHDRWTPKTRPHRHLFGVASSSEEDVGESSAAASGEMKAKAKPKTKKTSVAIVGSGAVGSYYGSRIWEATDGDGDDGDGEGERLYDVRFLARGDHHDACVRDGLHVSSIDGDVTIPPADIRVYDSPEKVGPVDWIVVALKSTSLGDAPSLVAPLLREDGTTRVVAVMNGLIDEDLVDMIRDLGGDSPTEIEVAREPRRARELVNASGGVSSPSLVEVETPRPRPRRSGVEGGGIVDDEPRRRPPRRNPLPCAAVYGGMALLCSNRVAPGRISHTYAGLLTCGVAATSRSIEDPSILPEDDPDLEAVREFFRPTAIDLDTETCLVRGRWLKNCWNLPYNGVSVAMGGITVDVICKDPGLRTLADKIMDETITVANADLRSRGVHPSNFIDRDAVKNKMWSFTDVMGPYKTSTMLDLLARKPMEVRYLFGKPLERARELNVSVPHFETVVLQIEAMQRLHGLF